MQVLWAFGKLNMPVEPALAAALVSHMHSQLPLFNPMDLSTALCAFARLGLQPGPEWLERALGCLERSNVLQKRCTPRVRRSWDLV